MKLTDVPVNQWHSVQAIAGDTAIDSAGADTNSLAARLQAIGFWAGEPVRLLRRSWFKHGPLVVQIGTATFALRRSEADCVEVNALGEVA